MLYNVLNDQLNPITLNFVVTDTIYIDIQERLSRVIQLSIDSIHIPLKENHRLVSGIALSSDHFVLTGARSYVEVFPEEHILFFDGVDPMEGGEVQKVLPIHLPFPKLLQASPSEVDISFATALFIKKSIKVSIEKRNFPRRRRHRILLEDTFAIISYTIQQEKDIPFSPENFPLMADYRQRNRLDSTVILVIGG